MPGGAGGKEVGRISIRVVPNTERFRSDLQRQLSAIEHEVRATVEVDVDLDEAGVKAKFRALMTELRAIGSRDLKVKADFDGGGAAVGAAASGASGAVGSLGHGLAIVAAVAALAAPALALISGVLVSLPAIISAVLVPIAAIALGLDGIKEAAKVLGPDFDALKATMSEKFKNVFTPIFTDLKKIFPALKASLPAVATGLGAVAQSIVDVVTSAPGMANIQGVIGNIAKTITDSAPGISKMTAGLLGLANKVSSKFPAVSTWLDKVGDSFTKWVDKASTADASGTSPLDRAMGNLGDTLKGVLDIIGDLANAGFEFLQDPKFGDSMKTFVADTKTLVNDILPGLKTMFQEIAGYLHTATDILDKIDKWKPPDWVGMTDKPKDTGVGGFPGVEPEPWKLDNGLTVIEDIKQAFATLGVEMSGIWTTMQVAAMAALVNIQALVNTVFSSIIGVVTNVVGTIGSTLGNIGGVLSSAWSGLGSIAAAAWQSVVQSVSSAMANALSAVVTGAGQIVAEIGALGGKVAGAVANFGSALVAAGKALMDGLLSGIKAGLSAVLDFASGIAAKIAAVKGPISYDKTVLTPNGQALMQGLQAGIEGGFEGVLSRASQLAGEIQKAINSGEPLSLDLVDQLKKQMAEIGLENDALSNAKNATTDKDQKKAITGQKQQLQTVRDQLKTQADQLKFADKYGDSLKENDSVMGDTLNKMITAGTGFATANMKQLQGDLGIGGGALSAGLDQGIGFATQMLGQLVSGIGGGGLGGKTEIHVNSVDEAMAAYRTEQNKKSLAYTR